MKRSKGLSCLMIAVLLVCSCLSAGAAGWNPAAAEVFRGGGLAVTDSTTKAVGLAIELVPHPPTRSFSLVPQFESANGKVLGSMDYAAYEKLQSQYQAQFGSTDGFDLWLINKFNNYRGTARASRKEFETLNAQRTAEIAAAKRKAAEEEKKPLPDLSRATHREVFAGCEIVVTDWKTQAVSVGAWDWPITDSTKVHFLDAAGQSLGYTTKKIWENTGAYDRALYRLPGGSEGFYAQMFNDYRGVARVKADDYLAYQKIRPGAVGVEGMELIEQVCGASSYKVVDASGWPDEIAERTSRARAAAGLPALEQDSELMKLAQIRAKELSETMSHTRPNGESATRWVLSETGYRSAGENIAAGYTSPQQAVEGWMSSPGHKANILAERYTAIGTGYYQDPDTGRTFWVQLFGG